MKSETQIRKEIEALRHLTTARLKEKYREVFGEESRSSHKQFLFRRVAWRIQANAWGGLSERAKRRALEIANDADLRIRAPKDFQRWTRRRPARQTHARPGTDRGSRAGADLVRRSRQDIVVRVPRGRRLRCAVRQQLPEPASPPGHGHSLWVLLLGLAAPE